MIEKSLSWESDSESKVQKWKSWWFYVGYSAQQNMETSRQEASCSLWDAMRVEANGETRCTDAAKTAIVCGNTELNAEVA